MKVIFMHSIKDITKRKYRIHPVRLAIFLTLLILGSTIRLMGLRKGLPYVYFPDEPNYVDIVQRMFTTGSLNPSFYYYPSVFFLLNAFAYIPYYLFGLCTGTFQSLNDIQGADVLLLGVGITPQPSAFVLGRAVTTLFGVASIALIWIIGKQLSGDWRTGFLAALLMALSPTQVKYSRYMHPHILLVFFLLLALSASIRLYHRGRLLDYILAGIACGLATSTMYHGAIIVASMLVAHFLRVGCIGWRDPKIYFACGLTLITFVLLNPYMFLNPTHFINDSGFIISHYLFGSGGNMAGDMGHALSYYLEYALSSEGGLPYFAFLGLVMSFFSRHKQSLLIYSFGVPYYIMISIASVRNIRTFLPVVPFLILGAVFFVMRISNWMIHFSANRKMINIVVSYGTILLLILGLGLPMINAFRATSQILKVDSRETARVWIANNLPHNTKLALESYSPYINPSDFEFQGFYRLIDKAPEWYISEQFDYLVFSQKMFGRFYRDPDLYSNEISKYEILYQQFDEVRTFLDGGYEVRIYQVPGK